MVWLSLVLLGVFAGTIAGLLGIGGGILIVPGLTFIFQMLDIPYDHIMHFAIGTSLAIMICTSSAAVIERHRRKEVNWEIFFCMVGGIVVGVIIGAYCTSLLSSNWLSIIFGIFLIVMSLRMFIGFKPMAEGEKIPSLYILLIFGLFVGFKSGLLGVGGGAVTVPFLCFCGLTILNASGTSSLVSLFISIIGSIAFIILGWKSSSISWSTGYIYWPGFLWVAPFSVIFAPLGAKASGYIAQGVLQKIFAVLLLILALKMFWF